MEDDYLLFFPYSILGVSNSILYNRGGSKCCVKVQNLLQTKKIERNEETENWLAMLLTTLFNKVSCDCIFCMKWYACTNI